MSDRPRTLHISALSPAEYTTYLSQIRLLVIDSAQNGTSHATKQDDAVSGDGAQIDKAVLRDFAIERLQAPFHTVDLVMNKIIPTTSTQVQPNEAFAILRMLAHASLLSKSTLLNMELLFTPAEPLPDSHFTSPSSFRLPLSRPPIASGSQSSRAAFTSRRSSAPLFKSGGNDESTGAIDPFSDDSSWDDATDKDVLGVDLRSIPSGESRLNKSPIPRASSNPFRRRHSSQPQPRAHLEEQLKPPPLPPRKPNALDTPPSLPPRHFQHIKKQSSSSSSHSVRNSSVLFPPTSTSVPSFLIRTSLNAAEKAKMDAPALQESTVHVIKRSGLGDLGESPLIEMQDDHTPSSPRLRRSELMQQVAHALREAEEETLRPPPSRKSSLRARDRFGMHAKPYLVQDPSTVLWDCVDILSEIERDEPYAMIILNQPISRRDTFVTAWNASQLRLCADGGANQLYDLWDSATRERYLPSMIKGDLDSIRPEVKTYYLSQGVPVSQDPDQYSTDLMKCITEVESREHGLAAKYRLLLIGGLSGRVDQTVHTMALLHKMRKTRPRTFVLSSESLAWVLDAGTHLINIDHSTMGKTCGILPVGVEHAVVSTRGLKWNLNWTTSFDGEISTSNHLLPSEPVVYIKTNRPIFWCLEVREPGELLTSIDPM